MWINIKTIKCNHNIHPNSKHLMDAFWGRMVREERRFFIQFEMSPATWHVKFNSLNHSSVSSQCHDFYLNRKIWTWYCNMKWNLKLKLNLYNLYFYALSYNILFFQWYVYPYAERDTWQGHLQLYDSTLSCGFQCLRHRFKFFRRMQIVDLSNVLYKDKDLNFSCIYRCFYYMSHFYLFLWHPWAGQTNTTRYILIS